MQKFETIQKLEKSKESKKENAITKSQMHFQQASLPQTHQN